LITTANGTTVSPSTGGRYAVESVTTEIDMPAG
jgi:hypothetical protein